MDSIDETVKGLNKELQFARENLKRVEKELAEVRARYIAYHLNRSTSDSSSEIRWGTDFTMTSNSASSS